ncbi:chitobiase/beta-hexosaminidase C-terminal domain-containing protein [Paenibacillus filicis]|uniref:Chitobiase/beta-hexosaminidase C-terminal domain-containing protein n=1 Tax=Paenibacillus filicis TaxID=669464 RepID=A0ABU9DK01_9BACL
MIREGRGRLTQAGAIWRYGPMLMLRLAVCFLLGLVFATLAQAAEHPAGHTTEHPPEHAAEVKKVQLYATDGLLTLPDGKQLYMWGYSLENKPGTAVFPGPLLEAEEGDSLEVTVTNLGAQRAGTDFRVYPIRLHGIDSPGGAEQALAVGQSDTRQIPAAQAGSHYYYAGDAGQYGVQMGMSGPFIVRAKGVHKQAWTGGPQYDKEYVFHLNELDPVWHKAAENGQVYDPGKFHPRYWTINGKSFPDVEEDPLSMIHGKVGEKILVRLINPGYDEHPMHLHGHHFQVIAHNGAPLDVPMDKDTVALDPGETKDILIVFDQSGHFPFHSHKILDNTNDGVYPGGLHTMTHIEEAGPSEGGTMTLDIGSTHAVVNGEHMSLDVAPFRLNGEAYVQLSFIAEQLAGSLQARAGDRRLTYKTEHTVTELWPLQTQALVNGRQVQLESPLLQVKGKAMVPVSYVSGFLCAKVGTGHSSDQIQIDYQQGQECQGSGPDHTPPTVTADPPGGTFASAQTVKLLIQDEDPQAKIYYTTDGTAPTDRSTLYTGPILIESTTMLKWIGIDTSGNTSAVQTAIYTIKQAPEVFVEVLDDKYTPAHITVTRGTTVTWILKGSMMHTVSSYDGVMNGIIEPNGNKRFSYTFNDTGVVPYFCMVHPFMTGSVTVQ